MGKRVLVVDDSQTVRAYYRKALEAAGFEVEGAESGYEALERALCESFDLFLVDINMTGGTGIEFLKEIRGREEFRAVPAVVVTSESGADDLLQSLASGANLHLVKPVSPKLLQDVCRILAGEAG
ncbi:MAG: response regulator [Thermacetogeniaceae bacterium]